MPINIERDTLIPPRDVSRLLGLSTGGRPVHVSSVVRMILRGDKLPDGSRLKLEAIRSGSRWLTTSKCVQEHMERLAAAWVGSHKDDGPTVSPAVRSREQARAAATLDHLGICASKK